MPFRAAHGISAAVSRHACDAGKSLTELSVDEYRRFSTLFDADIAELSLEQSITARDVPGGTAPARVAAATAAARAILDVENRTDRSTD
jgi:argininosuccinate lyase